MTQPLQDRIVALAASQHGVVTRGRLLASGLSSAAVGRRVTSGRLRALHRGVYLVGPIESSRAREMAAVLAGGPRATLSHTSALRLWKLLGFESSGPVHITVPGTGRRRRPGIEFHRVRGFSDDECATIDGMPSTSPARTIVDAAGMLGSREIERAVAAAERLGVIHSAELTGLPDRYPRRPGIAMLRALIRKRTEPHFTRSEAERRCLGPFRAAGLPRPHANVAVGPYELDIFWPEAGVAVEVDGWRHHSSRPRFEGDRCKDAWLRARHRGGPPHMASDRP